ncbi:cytochrome c1 [Stakelama tenebrarum]|uniref:Cytochrome c1 n=1 Tax=Stakelama tenebrarum TaxID=2711215 RepID=A0A6G6Y334_9SPHN|nr:cytochrome c1 [Sphingosinithalassobacter tenebrarum]QIG79128.1 cytochrome c1 [Sphingosinithalassobacter tenebrarum]
MSALFVKSIKFLIGIAFVVALLLALYSTVSGLISDPPAETAEHEFHEHPRDAELSSAGLFGTFDEQQLQRGFLVFEKVCAACHSLKYASFRELEGIGYSEAQVKAIAENWPIPQPTINRDTGEATTRPNMASDRFPLPFANNVAAAAANNNAVPPDLTYMAKARHDGPNYVYSLLTGYQEQPAELLEHFPAAKTPSGLHYNPYFANLNLAMPKPLTQEGQVEYLDGTRPTVDQMAKDVSAFLAWTAEPTLENRHAAGFATILFLIALGILTFGAYRSVWAGVKH